MKTNDKGQCLKHGRYMCCKCEYGRTPNNNECEPAAVKDCVDFINEERYVEAGNE